VGIFPRSTFWHHGVKWDLEGGSGWAFGTEMHCTLVNMIYLIFPIMRSETGKAGWRLKGTIESLLYVCVFFRPSGGVGR
jgi:hypothetical protein